MLGEMTKFTAAEESGIVVRTPAHALFLPRARAAVSTTQSPPEPSGDRRDWAARAAAGGMALLLLIGPLAAEAQPARRAYRIGVVNEAFAATHPTVEGLKTGLREAGLAEGRDVTFDIRFTEGDPQAARPAADALVKAGVDLIVTSQDGPTQAAKDATKTIPIVFTLVGDPVASGLVTNLAEPEANVTGVSSLQTELTAKRLEILKTLVPSLRRVWLIHYGGDLTANKMIARARDAAPRVKVELVSRAVLNTQELAQALGEVRPTDALLAPEIATLDIPVAVLNASLKSRTPAVFTTALWVGHGGLASYGPDYYAQGVQAAGLVARILRGARPSDVPVEGADRIELAVNLKTAELLGVTVPRKIMLRADTFRR
jgi:putative ABC transport system substrate-binding protein